ncbi:RES family NAD+ phosphorylase [Pseudomonas sp.]|uniref:RES family NAD+ phosphorylase n=1 Tax=Pseudomonas sp. TaxID=306 RepID=UPI002735D519|nr:RES domain-containing protein [Pseudomonas sp.]MDP3814666.1 RES domain-containing protein [Pseudomonas sp.]
MQAWRVGKAKHANDLSGNGAAIAGGRWNDTDVPALYLGLTPAICCLEAFVNASGPPTVQMKLTRIELPDEPDLYLEPEDLPDGWDSKPADRASMDFGTRWLMSRSHLGLIVPSSVLPAERNIVINPRHPAASRLRVIEVQDFFYDPRMFSNRTAP